MGARITGAALTLALAASCRPGVEAAAAHTPAAVPVSTETARKLGPWLARVERDLTEDVLPFWTRNTVLPSGGFTTHLDRSGERLANDRVYLLVQARMIWSLSAAHRHGLTSSGYLSRARAGVRFLTEAMRDAERGGYFYSVGFDGTPAETHKSVYVHSFVIYALSEYALASGDDMALRRAVEVFDLLRERAADGEAGYVEMLTRAWEPKPGPKTLDTHMHLMEAFTVLAEASGRREHRDELRRLVKLLLSRAVHPVFECGLSKLTVDPGRVTESARTSYGHNVEFAWLLLDALAVLGEPPGHYDTFVLGMIDHALAYGCDPERGGVALYGPLTGHVADSSLPASRLTKSWWEQAEMLVALAEIFDRTRDEKYLRALLRELDWVWRYQIDHERGDWYEKVSWEGRPLVSNKGHSWKCAYHNARALMRVSRALRRMGVEPIGED